MTNRTISPLRQRMVEDMNARQLGPHSQRSHIYSCERFASFLKRSPDTATADDVRRFQRAAHPDFLRSIHAGRDEADEKVTKSLYQRACGYSHKAVKIFMPAGAEEPVYADYTEHYPPDTQAASLWLRNRQPARWRDQQHVKHTGTINYELSDESRAALEETVSGLALPISGANGTVKH